MTSYNGNKNYLRICAEASIWLANVTVMADCTCIENKAEAFEEPAIEAQLGSTFSNRVF